MDNQHMLPSRSGEGFPAANSLYPDSQHFATPSYDPLLAPHSDSGFGDTNNWGMDAGGGGGHINPSQSRASLQGWQNPQQSANAIRSHQHSPLPHLHNNNINHHHHHLHQHLHDNVAPRALSHSPAAFTHPTIPFTGYTAPSNTFAYNQSSYDPALFNPTGPSGQDFESNTFASFDSRGTNGPHVTPLQQFQNSANLLSTNIPGTPPNPQYHLNANGLQASVALPTPPTADSRAIAATIPRGDAAGLFTIINFDALAGATKSERLGNYLNVGKEAFEWPLNTAAVPPYVPRKSRNDLKRLAGTDAVLLAKIARSASKSSGRGRSLHSATRLSDKPLTTAKGASLPVDSKVDLSSSSDESSDDEDSSYTSDEDLENPPLPTTRSANPKDAVEYDVTKALWRSKRRPVEGSSIRKALADFWDTVKTIRDRWKADTAAVTDAESKKQVSDLPLLQSRVKDSRDMIEIAFKTALKHGHRSLLELFAENLALMYLCYQFLLDRFKENELNGPLARAILEVLSICTTLNREKLEKTHLDKVIPRYIKKGDAKTQFYAKRINANATGPSTENTTTKSTDSKDSKASPAPASTSTKAEPTTAAKRITSGVLEGAVQKKATPSAQKTIATAQPISKANGLAKKPVVEGAKPAATPPIASLKAKAVATKPSTFFSSLQSATKKPGTSIKTGTAVSTLNSNKTAEKNVPAAKAGTSAAPKPTFSFAETMANLTKPKEQKVERKEEETEVIETMEEKEKRLRKEARRKLRVTFRPADELEQIRYFTHDPDEDYGHDSSQMRDVADVGGEGRMLKEAHQRMADYDDEDDPAPEEEAKLIDFSEPRPIDFSGADAEEIKRNYYKFGGTAQPDSAERTKREEYEAKTLIVYYTDSSDIPPTPREPPESEDVDKADGVTSFGLPDKAVLEKVQNRTTLSGNANSQPQSIGSQPGMGPTGNLSSFFPPAQLPIHQMTVAPPQQTSVPQPPTAMNIDLQAILENLKSSMPASNQPPPQMQGGAPAIPNFGSFPALAPSSASPSGANIDLGAILAQLNAGQANASTGPSQAQPLSHAPSGYNQPLPNNFENLDRKRMRENDWEDNNAGANKRVHHLFRTKPCKFWLEGKCLKGDNCTYVHEGEP